MLLKSHTILVLILLLTLNSCMHKNQSQLSQASNTNNSCIPNKNNCDFYDCFEQKKSCGERGYIKGYVGHYCKKFLEFCPGLFGLRFQNDKAKKWLVGTRKCLQDEMVPFLNGNLNQTSCEEIRKAGFDSHAYCYIDGAKALSGVGFCDLSATTWIEVANCVKTGLVSIDGASQVLDVFSSCTFGTGSTNLTDTLQIEGDILDYNQPIEETPENRRIVMEKIIESLQEKSKKPL